MLAVKSVLLTLQPVGEAAPLQYAYTISPAACLVGEHVIPLLLSVMQLALAVSLALQHHSVLS